MTDVTEHESLQGLDTAPGNPSPGAPPRSLDEFLAEVERRAFRLAQLALGHREDALDAVQEAMIKLMHYQHRAPAEWSPLFWSILRRQLTDRHRRNAVKHKVMAWFGGHTDSRSDEGMDPIQLVVDHAPTPEDRATQDGAFVDLGKALRELPRRQRECFLLRELQGLSVAETATAMGCSEGSVKTHLSRASAALRAKLEAWR